MNPPDDERTEENKCHKEVHAEFGNYPIEKVEKTHIVEHGAVFHTPFVSRD